MFAVFLLNPPLGHNDQTAAIDFNLSVSITAYDDHELDRTADDGRCYWHKADFEGLHCPRLTGIRSYFLMLRVRLCGLISLIHCGLMSTNLCHVVVAVGTGTL